MEKIERNNKPESFILLWFEWTRCLYFMQRAEIEYLCNSTNAVHIHMCMHKHIYTRLPTVVGNATWQTKWSILSLQSISRDVANNVSHPRRLDPTIELTTYSFMLYLQHGHHDGKCKPLILELNDPRLFKKLNHLLFVST